MNPQKILKIDRWLGRPICLGLTAIRRLGDLFGFARADAPPKKILFIKMIEQGATVLAYAAIRRAVEMVGRENVYFWVFEENRPILDLLDVIPRENVLVLRAGKMRTFAWDVCRTLLRIRRLAIDATIDMEFFARAPAILAFLTGARRRVGLHRYTSEAPYRGDLLTHRVQHNLYLHTAVLYDLLVESLQAAPSELPLRKRPAADVDTTPPRFMPTAIELESLQSRLHKAAPASGDGPLVLLNSNAGDLLPLRRWPTERFAELACRLLSTHSKMTIVFTGGPSEAGAAEQLVRQVNSPRAVSMAGKTTLRELLCFSTWPTFSSPMTAVRAISLP